MPASIAVIVAGVYVAKGILIPCALSILLSFLLSPVCDWLERWRLGRIPAVLVTATVGFGILAVLIWTAAIQVSHLAPKIPEYRDNVVAKLNSVNKYGLASLSQLTRARDGIGCGAILVSNLADAQKQISLLTAPHATLPTQQESKQSS